MANDSLPPSQMVDLTGLPEPVIQSILVLVEKLREQQKVAPAGSSPIGKRRPLKGRFAEPNLSIPKEQIDEAQRETWSGFPREFPDSPKSS